MHWPRLPAFVAVDSPIYVLTKHRKLEVADYGNRQVCTCNKVLLGVFEQLICLFNFRLGLKPQRFLQNLPLFILLAVD